MVSHRRAARRVGPPSIAQCGAAAARGCRRWAVRGRSESILSKLQYTSGTGNQGHFWPWQESCLPAVRCAAPARAFAVVVYHSCCSGQLCCLLVGCTSVTICTGVQASIYCTALGGAPVGQHRTEPGLEPFAFRAARGGGGTCAATAAVAPWRRGKALTD